MQIMQKLKASAKDIPIFFSCDDAYVPYLAVSLLSLKQNANQRYNYKIKVLHSGAISQQNQSKIIKLYSEQWFDVKFVDITEHIAGLNNKFHTRDYYSKSTYYRLFIPNLYPQYDKALYLDCDITVLGDISKLYQTELGTNLVGAVADESVAITYEFQEYVLNKIGVVPSEYFNAGILVLNLKRLREINFENMFLRLISCITFDVAQDQDYLNAICRGRAKILPNTWNKMPFKDDVSHDKIGIIHYNLNLKPWKQDKVLFEEYFWAYAKDCGYYAEIKRAKKANAKTSVAKSQTNNLIEQTLLQSRNKKENARVQKLINEICFADSQTEPEGQDLVAIFEQVVFDGNV